MKKGRYEFVNDYSFSQSNSGDRINIKFDQNKRMISIKSEELLEVIFKNTQHSGLIDVSGCIEVSGGGEK